MSTPFVFVWDVARHGSPQNMKEAIDLVKALVNTPEEPSEAVIAFATELDAFIQKSDCEEWRDAVRSLSGRARTNAKAMFRFEHPEVEWERLLVHMIYLTKTHPVGLFMEGDGVYVIPPGELFPYPARMALEKRFKAALSALKDIPRKQAEFQEWFAGRLLEILRRHGEFERASLPEATKDFIYFSRQGDKVVQYVGVCVEKFGSAYSVGINFKLTSDVISNIIGGFNFISSWLLFGALIVNISDPRDYIRCEDDVKRVLSNCESQLFPSLDRFMLLREVFDIFDTDKYPFYKKRMANSTYNPQILTMSRVLGATNFDQLCVELSQKHSSYFFMESWDVEWSRLVKYLKEEVTPLADC